jgi:uncharacterized protein YcgI (DUF1989 family)
VKVRAAIARLETGNLSNTKGVGQGVFECRVDLRAEMDLLVVISNCPECDNPAAGFEPTPVRAIVYSPA